MDSNPAEDYASDLNNTPLFDVISSGSDEVEGAVDGPGLEIDYYNGSGQMVFIGDGIAGTSWPITVADGQALTFDFAMRPIKGLVFEWSSGVCTGVFTGDLQIAIAADIE